MDSINMQQEEDNFENLQGTAAIKKIKELTDKSPSCSFVHTLKPGNHLQPVPWLYRKWMMRETCGF